MPGPLVTMECTANLQLSFQRKNEKSDLLQAGASAPSGQGAFEGETLFNNRDNNTNFSQMVDDKGHQPDCRCPWHRRNLTGDGWVMLTLKGCCTSPLVPRRTSLLSEAKNGNKFRSNLVPLEHRVYMNESLNLRLTKKTPASARRWGVW